MRRCKSCRKILWTKGQGVEVVKARPTDDAGSLMLLSEEDLAISTLNNVGSYVDAGDIRAGVTVCRSCWTEKLEPRQRAEIDRKVDAIRTATHETPAVEMMPLGDLTAEYYITQLADLLDETSDKNVRGWILYCAAHRIQNFSSRTDEIARTILVPKISEFTHDRDYDISRAAKLAIRAFDGQLGMDEWNVFTPSWTGFRKLP